MIDAIAPPNDKLNRSIFSFAAPYCKDALKFDFPNVLELLCKLSKGHIMSINYKRDWCEMSSRKFV
uniref:Uncharacterized protein n=1 Tax=Romanomermis culicivorax TaxID=13658 RepID=A0A915IRL1_ROMCU